jgi:uncharacterized membrane protein
MIRGRRDRGEQNVGMADDEPAARQPLGISTARLEAFSDGVLAIAITLLVLELSVPEGSDDDLVGAIRGEWRSYLAYTVSFSTVGALWLAHSSITRHLGRTNPLFVRLNLLFLLVVSFLPFPTRVLGEYSGDDEPARVATTFYGLTLLAAALLVAVLWRCAVGTDLIRENTPRAEVQALTLQLTPGLAGYVVLLGLGLFVPTVAVVGYLVLALALIVPFGLMKAARGHLHRAA